MTHNIRDSEAAEGAFRLGYEDEASLGVCSQCTERAVMNALGTRNPDLFNAAFGFAGGIGDLSKACGALAGGILMISWLHGRPPEDLEGPSETSRRRCLETARDLHDRFVDRHGSIDCADVHRTLFGRTFNQWAPTDFEESLRLGRPCRQMYGSGGGGGALDGTDPGLGSRTRISPCYAAQVPDGIEERWR